MTKFLKRLALISAVAAALIAGSRVEAQGFLDVIGDTPATTGVPDKNGGRTTQQKLYEQALEARAEQKEKWQQHHEQKAEARAEEVREQKELREEIKKEKERVVSSGTYNRPGITRKPENCLEVDMDGVRLQVRENLGLNGIELPPQATPVQQQTAVSYAPAPPARDGLSQPPPDHAFLGYPYTDY